MTRDDVLDVLDQVVRLKRRGVQRAQVPVRFMEDRIGVSLPSDAFPPDQQIRLGGKFQVLMSRQRAHAFIDFVDDWQGIDTQMPVGFS
ncbi:MAG: hypothetical protein ACK46X_10380 [Candidatus Sericytochromatia bacterium]